MTRYILYTFIFLCGTAAYRYTPTNVYALQAGTAKKHTPYYDTSKIVVLTLHIAGRNFVTGAKPMHLEENDFSAIDEILNRCINERNKEDSSKENGYYLILSKYKRQYVPYISKDKHRMVWISCSYSDWFIKKHIVYANDVGSYYFTVTIDLTTGQYSDFHTNCIGG